MQIITSTESQSSSRALIERLFQVPVKKNVLENGLTFVHRPDFSSEVVSVQVWVKTGSIHEADLIGSGLSHYLEHLLFKGTERRTGKSISREVHSIGGGINAYTTFDRTVYYIDAPSSAFEQVVDILSDIVLHSTLPADELERERDVILREIDMGLDDPDRMLSQALFRTAFQKYPYREPVIGHRALYEQVTRDELWAYYKARYVPNNIVVSVAGAVSPEDCQTAINASFGEVPRGRLAPVSIEVEPIQLSAREERITGDFNIFRGGLAFKVPHLSHPDSPKLDALAHALGGGESSILWEALRNGQKLVHYIDCRNWNPGDQGLFWISYVCDAEHAAEVEEAVLKCIETIKADGFSAEAVEKARRQALSGEINGRKTMSGQASRLGLGEVVIGDLNYGRQYLARLDLVEPEDLRTVAATYLVNEGRSTVTLGPADLSAVKVESDSFAAVQPFELHECKGGGRILIQTDARLPKVHLRCVLRAGALFEPENQRGITDLMGSLLTKDTESRTGSEISSLIESIGGTFSAACGNNTLSLAIEVLPTDLNIALELLTEALTASVFDQATFETELEAHVAGLKEDDDEIMDYGFRRLRERFFEDHPFSVSSDGSVSDLESLKREDVVAHFKRVVVASNLVISAAGDFDAVMVQEYLQNLLEERVSQAELNEPIDGIFEGPSVAFEGVESMDREQAVVLHGYPDAGIFNADYYASEMLNELFSGMSSRLFEQVREDKGMAYYVGSSRVVGLRTGMFVFYAGTHPDQAQAVVEEIDLEIERIKAGEIEDEELVRCRTRLKAARPMGRQTIGARAVSAAMNLTYGLPIDDDDEYFAKLDEIDASILASFAKKHFDQNRSVRLIVKSDEN